MAPLLELKLAPSTLTRDLVLRPRDKYYAAALSAGTKMPGMGVIRDIFALAHFCAPSLGVIPKESLIRLTKDLDYVFGLHYLVARYMLNARDYPETALEVKAQFIEGLRDPNTISLRHIIHGYDVFMNNFMMHLPGGHYRELEGAAPLPGEPEPAYEEGSVSAQLLQAQKKLRSMHVLLDDLIRTKLGRAPADHGLSYGAIGASPISVENLQKRKELFLLLEALVCEHHLPLCDVRG